MSAQPTGINIDIEYDRAMSAINLNRPDMAIEAMQRVLSVFPTDFKAHRIIAQAKIGKQDYEGVLASLNASLEAKPSDSFTLALFGLILPKTQAGCWQDAEDAFKKALELNPYNDMAYCWYAEGLHTFTKRINEASEFIRKAIELAPNKANYHLVYGHILADQKQLQQAELQIKKALELEPDNYYVHNNYGVFLMNNCNRPKEALPYFREALRSNPGDKDVLHNYMLALKAKHPLYHLFWNYSLFARKLGKNRGVLLAGAYIGIRLLISISSISSAFVFLRLLGILLFLSYICFMIYITQIDRIFTLLINKGWLK